MATRYLTTAQLVAMFGNPLIGVAGLKSQTPLADDAFDAFINLAEDEVDVYVGSAYALPLQSVPPIVERIVADIARWFIYNSKPGSQAEPSVMQRYDAAVVLMKQIRDGKLTLGVPNQDVAVAQPTTLPLFNVPVKRFNPRFFNGF
jgi:phage gp36-like protein